LRLPALLCLAAAAALGADFAALKPQGYVSDFANVVDAASRAELDRYCGALERAAGVQFALVTLPSLEGEPPEDVANTLYRAWGVGKKDTNEGLLLLLSVRDRRMRLEVGYGLEPIITDGDAGEILRAMRPFLRQGQYGPAMIEAAHLAGARIAQAKNVALDTPPPQQRQSKPKELPIPGALIFGGIILFALLSGIVGGRGRGRYRGGRGGFGGGLGGILPGLIIGAMTGRSTDWHRRGGGGFGGFDSGGGFGGFGGGDSGGGGASSNW
jgi:uncharacterized protein